MKKRALTITKYISGKKKTDPSIKKIKGRKIRPFMDLIYPSNQFTPKLYFDLESAFRSCIS